MTTMTLLIVDSFARSRSGVARFEDTALLPWGSCPLLFREECLRAVHRRHRVRPTDVERQVGDHLDELLLRHSVLDRIREVEIHLLGLAARDECGAGHEAPITLRELTSLPHVGEQDI